MSPSSAQVRFRGGMNSDLFRGSLIEKQAAEVLAKEEYGREEAG